MFLDNRETYLKERSKLLQKSKRDLEILLEGLHKRRFEEHDIQIDAYYRLVSHVYNVRVRNGSSLIFHLKNFLGIVGSMILTSYL